MDITFLYFYSLMFVNSQLYMMCSFIWKANVLFHYYKLTLHCCEISPTFAGASTASVIKRHDAKPNTVYVAKL